MTEPNKGFKKADLSGAVVQSAPTPPLKRVLCGNCGCWYDSPEQDERHGIAICGRWNPGVAAPNAKGEVRCDARDSRRSSAPQKYEFCRCGHDTDDHRDEYCDVLDCPCEAFVA